MNEDKIIITVNNINDIESLKKLGIQHFAFPLKDFCVGIPNTFLISEVLPNEYIFINRILDNEGIDNLKETLKMAHVKGIIFDDLGVIPLIKDMDIEKILYLSHFNTNIESVKYYLDYVDSVILSTEITKKEIVDIVTTFSGKLTLFILGYLKAMYSRRLLINNYTEFYNLEKQNPLRIENGEHQFLVYENDYGTCFYHLPLFNGLELLELNAKYFFINSAFLEVEDIKKLLNNEYSEKFDKGFLYQETIYKLKGGSK